MSRTTVVVACAAALSCAALAPAVGLGTAHQATPSFAAGHAHAGHTAGHTGDAATAVVRGVDGERHGTVRLRQTSHGVQVTARLHGLPAGFHGFHVHSTGVCDPEAADGPFATAGGHYPGSTGSEHAAHAGDMPSLLAVGEGGRAHAMFVTDRFSVEELMDADGSAVMVHAGADNFANIPADRYRSRTRMGVPDPTTLTGGDSGDRMACGVVRHGGAH
jgi:Cu-Zn family superoxide dismutase